MLGFVVLSGLLLLYLFSKNTKASVKLSSLEVIMSSAVAGIDNGNGRSSKKKNNNKQKQKSNYNRKRQRSSNPFSSSTGPAIGSKKLSHALSWALRHAAPQLKLTMMADGYVPVQEILDSSHPKFRGVTLDLIQHVVDTSDKQRFSLAERPRQQYYDCADATAAVTAVSSASTSTDTILCIRANQGHSIKTIDPNLIYIPLQPDKLLSFPMIVHGTYNQCYQSILQSGLKCMNRTHIHFAPGLVGPSEAKTKEVRRNTNKQQQNKNNEHDETKMDNKHENDTKGKRVTSGMRSTAQIYIYIDARKCIDNGIPFFQSSNGVILTDGGEKNHGTLPIKYFSHVTDAEGTILLDQRNEDYDGQSKA